MCAASERLLATPLGDTVLTLNPMLALRVHWSMMLEDATDPKTALPALAGVLWSNRGRLSMLALSLMVMFSVVSTVAGLPGAASAYRAIVAA